MFLLFSGDHLMIGNLKSNSIYSVVVEARKMQTYTAFSEGMISMSNFES